ncbi:MAG: L-lactate permease [Pseudomonadota bacterium]|uniref:L-lactate permease n=3 Tax=Burkholderiaceae TaxID=119060 RepID=UPI0010F5F204|nr:L-lactate permease [Burkholderia sp. 4M9327F10]
MYQQIYDPIAHSIGASAIFAAIPLIVLFVLLGVFKLPARWAAVSALISSMIVAVAVYGMPVVQTGSVALEGASIGFFPIIWIGINAIWLFKLTQSSSHDVVLRSSLSRASPDLRVQAVLVAFCFGSLLESLAGGGAPVAICAVMLIAIGVDPLKAAAICLLADTSPVAFGSLGLPITVLAKITQLPAHSLAVMVGRQTPFLALFIPLILVVVADGRRSIREVWPLAVVAGATFAFAQSVGSMVLPIELVDIVSALTSTISTVLFLKVWSPSVIRDKVQADPVQEAPMAVGSTWAMPTALGAIAGGHNLAQGVNMNTSERSAEGGHSHGYRAGSNGPSGKASAVGAHNVSEIARALGPYGAIILLVALMQIKPIGHLLGAVTSTFDWPGLNVLTASGARVPVKAKFEWLSSAGSIVLLAGILVTPILRLSWRRAFSAYLSTLHELRWAVFTVCCVVGVAYVMNLSGQVVTLGIFAANAGPMFAFVSPVLGWIATALTGSDTSANALFGILQTTTAHHTGLSSVLLAAANSSGGVVGKAISPQNLTIAAVAVGMAGKEGLLFRRVFGWTLLMIAFMSVLVFLQSTSVLGWMVP